MRSLCKLLTMAVATALVVLSAAAAEAQCPPGRPCPPPVRYYQPVYRVGAAPAYQAPAAEPRYYAPIAATQPPTQFAAQSTVGDPLAWINAARARRGLHALRHDANLSGWAAINNGQCYARRALGHFATCGAGQIAASTSDPASAVSLWERSPAHAAILFSPTATVAGIDHSGGFSTANVR